MRLLGKIKNIFNKETLLYVFFGLLTTLVNYAIYFPLLLLNIDYKIANIIAWIIAVIFSFITNKLLVFKSESLDNKVLLREGLLFVGARIFSLFIEEGFLIYTVEFLGASEFIMKIIAAIVVIILNYFFSKIIIFRKAKNEAKKDS